MTLSYALAVVCLVWVFHDYNFSDLVARIAALNLPLLAMAIICDVLSVVCQGWRWRLVLKPFASVSVLLTAEAIYSGMFVNEVLPLKIGELLRGYLISRWSSLKVGTVATSILVERLFDGFWLASGFVAIMIFVPMPHKLMEAGDAFSAVILILITLLIALSLRRASLQALVAEARVNGQPLNAEGKQRKRNPVGRNLARSVAALLDRSAVELRAILHSPSSLSAFALSLLFLSLQCFAFWLAMLAFGLHRSPWVAAAVFVIVHVGTSLPAAPANIGTYQFGIVFGLTLFGVDKTSAAGFSLIAFVVLSIHIWVLGFWALRRSGLTLFGMRTELSRALPNLKTDT